MDVTIAAKLVAISTAFMMAGYGINASQSSVPMLYNQPTSVSLPLFTSIFYKGAAVMSPAAVISSGASAYLAYLYPQQRQMWATAGALVFAIGPFTQFVMLNGIHRLIHVSESSSVEQDKAQKSGEVLRLLKAWTMQNWMRVGLNFTGGFIGLWTALNSGI